jgi:hypothetical protein
MQSKLDQTYFALSVNNARELELGFSLPLEVGVSLEKLLGSEVKTWKLSQNLK